MEKNRIIILLFLSAVFAALLPLFTENCINGHDLEYHLLRIESLKEGILAGQPFLKVNMLYFGGRGYASSLFYPDFLLYIPAILRCTGVSINASYHIFVGICMLLSFVTMYYSVRLMILDGFSCKDKTGDESFTSFGVEIKKELTVYCPTAAGIVYMLSQYHIDDIYTRAAVGEFTAMIFLPFLIYGLYDLVFYQVKRPLLMIAGFSGCILCHTNTTVFVIALYLAGFAAGFIYNRGYNAGFYLRMAVYAAFVFAITAFYTLPVMEQFLSDTFQTGAGNFDLDYEKLLVRDIFKNENKCLGLALPLLAVIVTGLYMTAADYCNDTGKENKRRVNAVFSVMCAGLAVFISLCTTGFFPWKRFQGILGFVQFPCRLFIIVTALLSVYIAVLGAEVFSKLKSGNIRLLERIMLVFVTAVMIASAVSNINRTDLGYYSYSDDYYAFVPHTGTVIGGEWLPSSVTDRGALTKDCDMAVSDTGREITVKRKGSTLSFDVLSEEGYIDVPFIYYKGYESVPAFDMDGTGDNGSVRVYTNGYEGSVTVVYTRTLIQTGSAVISGMAFLLLILLYQFKYLRLDKSGNGFSFRLF